VTKEIPAPAPQPAGGDDDLARKESEFLGAKAGPPELVEAQRRHLIDVIEIRRAFMYSIRQVAYVLPFLGLVMLVVWLWHLLAPVGYRWLPTDEINHLQALLFSGSISALATAIATKKI
jgi:hypothetical protein